MACLRRDIVVFHGKQALTRPIDRRPRKCSAFEYLAFCLRDVGSASIPWICSGGLVGPVGQRGSEALDQAVEAPVDVGGMHEVASRVTQPCRAARSTRVASMASSPRRS